MELRYRLSSYYDIGFDMFCDMYNSFICLAVEQTSGMLDLLMQLVLRGSASRTGYNVHFRIFARLFKGRQFLADILTRCQPDPNSLGKERDLVDHDHNGSLLPRRGAIAAASPQPVKQTVPAKVPESNPRDCSQSGGSPDERPVSPCVSLCCWPRR